MDATRGRDGGWAELMQRASRRHGIVTYDELVRCGLGRHQISHLACTGRLVSVGRGSYLVAGAPVTFAGRVLGLIEVHGVDTWGARRTAAALWRVAGYPEDHRIELLRHADASNQRRVAVVHRSSCIPPEHVTIHRGVPVTTVARTLFDLAAQESVSRLRLAVAGAVRADLCTDAAIWAVLHRLGGRGRPGTRRMRLVLEERIDVVPGHSELEALCRAVILGAGLPEPEWEVDLADEQGWIGRVDGCYRVPRIVIECDSARWHGQRSDELHDARRDARLVACGYVVLRPTWFDLTLRPDAFVAELRALLEARPGTDVPGIR